MSRWIRTVAVLFVLFLAGAFALRMGFYYRALQSGTLRPEDLRFAAARSVSAALASQPLPDGTFDLATDDDPSLGSPDAAVTIVEFADFGCPYSQASSFVLRTLAQEYGGRVRYVYRDFPILELHPDAAKAAEAGNCAVEQGKFWEYHDKLYVNQNDLSFDALVGYARALNLDTAAFRACLQSGRHEGEVFADLEAGIAAGVVGTPTFFINGNRIPGAIPEDVLRGLIEGILNRK